MNRAAFLMDGDKKKLFECTLCRNMKVLKQSKLSFKV